MRCRKGFGLVLLISLVAAPLFSQSAPVASLKAVGSTTIQPVIEEIAAGYHELSGVTVEVLGSGSEEGLEALRAGTANIGMVSRSLTAEEREEFSYTTIGHDGLAIIVNRENPREHITTAELREIYTGQVRIWDDAPQWAQDIVLVSKQAGRGTLAVFEEYTGLVSPGGVSAGTGDRPLISGHAWEAGSNLDSILWVGGIPGAIGFVSIGHADQFISIGHPIKKLTLDGVPADTDSIRSGTYPMVRELNLVYRDGDESALAIVRYMVSESARTAISAHGYVPSEVR